MSARPWAEAGYDVYCYDLLHKQASVEYVGAGTIRKLPWDARNSDECEALVASHLGRTALVLAYPPCTDLAVSGAKHFAAKRAADPQFQHKAMELVTAAVNIAEALDAPFALENPVGVIPRFWRKPDHTFDPFMYGGYLPSDDVHPLYPEYIEPRDAYPKNTCLWTGNGFVMPERKVVMPLSRLSKAATKLGGKSEKTKRIRATSPRGFALAVFIANRKDVE